MASAENQVYDCGEKQAIKISKKTYSVSRALLVLKKETGVTHKTTDKTKYQTYEKNNNINRVQVGDLVVLHAEDDLVEIVAADKAHEALSCLRKNIDTESDAFYLRAQKTEERSKYTPYFRGKL